MPREYRAYLEDILEAVGKIREYTSPFTQAEDLGRNEMAFDAVVRNFEVIGEAVKNLPEDIRNRYDDIGWKGIAGLRDILIHQYFGVSDKIVWDIVRNELPLLETKIKEMLSELD